VDLVIPRARDCTIGAGYDRPPAQANKVRSEPGAPQAIGAHQVAAKPIPIDTDPETH